MEYNTEREKLVLPEYGRHVQNLVKYAISIPDRQERLVCARNIVKIMSQILSKDKAQQSTEQTLWDHLALLSNYQLDIDWPFEINRADEIQRPEKMPYPTNNIRYRHYGHLLESLVRQLGNMDDSEEKTRLIELAANQMRKDLYYSSKNSLNELKIADDIHLLSSGNINISQGPVTYNQSIPTGNSNKTSKKKKTK